MAANAQVEIENEEHKNMRWTFAYAWTFKWNVTAH